MNASTRGILLGFVGLVLGAGCSGSQQASETSTDTTAMAPPVSTPEPTSPAGPAWVAELHEGGATLGQMVEQGRLKEVHDQAIKLQSVLKQATAQASSLTPEQQQLLTEHVNAADRLADELHDAADAGDLTKTKSKFQEFQTHLRGVEGVFGVATP